MKDPKIMMRASSVSDLISAMKSDMGVGFISHEIAKDYPMLVPIDGITIYGGYQLWILTHRDLKKVPKIDVFMKFIKAEFASKNKNVV